MNVVDKYKGWEVDLIRQDVQANVLDHAICMVNFEYDFNLGTLVRNANAFGAREVFYVQDRKKWDRRSSVGVQNYTDVIHLKTLYDLFDLRDKYTFVAVENGIGAKRLGKFKWPKNSLIIMGSENQGIPQDVLNFCQYKVEIPMMGSVRSLNVGTASGIVLNDYVSKYNKSWFK